MATDSVRFWSKVQRGDGCWTWTGRRNAAGYGGFDIRSRSYLAHRIAWELTHGAIPEGACVLHRCDTPACCNPEHLFLGDRAANNADMVAKGRLVNPLAETYRARSHCSRGHAYTAENTREARGSRQCRECMRLYNRERFKRDREKCLARMRQAYQRRRDRAQGVA